MPSTPHHILLGLSNQQDELGRANSMHGREERFTHRFGGETREKETTWKTQA
jgi:hypothetical protein